LKTAQKIKLIPMLLLLWTLPMSLLPRATARPRETAPSKLQTHIIGVLRDAEWLLSNGFEGTVDIGPFIFGNVGVKPVAGDWNGDGIDTIGAYNGSTGTMALNNTNSAGNGVGDIVFNFGQKGDIPLAGDWDGKPSTP